MKNKQKTILKQVVIGILIVFGLILVVGPFVFSRQTAAEDIKYGATYSAMYADELGIDPLEGFEAVVKDLGVSMVRIPVYWDRIELERDVFEWDELDAMMDLADDRDIDVILAIGRRVPRWPECFSPDWALELAQSDLDTEQLQMVRAVVERYRDRESLLRWQVENEPFLKWFGECPDLDEAFFLQEVNLVRSLDRNTVIMTTASGEQSLWTNEAKLTDDMVGVSVYRTVHNPIFGYLTYPIPTWAYRAKAKLLGETQVIVSELQAEPWFAREVGKYTVNEQLEIFDVHDLEKNLSYVENIGFPEVYVWGVEWWYFLKMNDKPELWEAGKMIF